ncbi:MAG: transcription initiation factor IIB [archaeon]
MSVENEICDHCGSEDLIEDEETGEIICAECGLVVSEVSLIGRDFIEEESQTITSRTISPRAKRKMDRLMVLDHRLRVDAQDPYVLRLAGKEIKRLIQSLHLSDFVEKSAESIYRRAQKDGLVIRGTINGFAAASVYAACRVQGIPRTLREVSEVSPDNVKDIARMYRILLSELNISVELDNPLKHLTRIAQEAGISLRAERIAGDTLMEVMKKGHHTGKNPKGLAASALYVVCKEIDEKCTQDELSELSGVSTVTIRKRVKAIREAVELNKLIEES